MDGAPGHKTKKGKRLRGSTERDNVSGHALNDPGLMESDSDDEGGVSIGCPPGEEVECPKFDAEVETEEARTLQKAEESWGTRRVKGFSALVSHGELRSAGWRHVAISHC